MSIRIRTVDGVMVALCAARSVPKPGDIYLDDRLHMALTLKFWQDYPDAGVVVESDVVALTEQEESNNSNRAEWDVLFQKLPPLTQEQQSALQRSDARSPDVHWE